MGSSSIECLPEYMKGVYMGVYDTINEMAQEAEKVQGRDTVNYVFQFFLCENVELARSFTKR